MRGRCLATCKVVMIILWDLIMFSLHVHLSFQHHFHAFVDPKLQDEISKTCHECDMLVYINHDLSLEKPETMVLL